MNAAGGTVRVDTAGTALTLTGALSGPGTLTVAGPGIVGLAAAGTYTTNVKIDGGTLRIDSDTAAGAISFNGAISGTTGTLVLKSSNGNSITIGSGASDTVANTFSGPTNVYGYHIFLNKAPGTNAIGGDLNIEEAHWPVHGITLDNDEQIADTGVLTFDTAVMTDAYDFRLNGHTETIAGIVTTSPTPSSMAIIENAGYDGGNDSGIPAGTLIVSGSGTYTYNGQLRDQNNGTNGNLSFTKAGSGVQVLIGSAINYSGTTRITGGVLRLNSTSIGASGNMILNGGVLELQSPSTFTRSLGTDVGQVQLTGGTSGFSAFGAPLTITLNNSAASTVQWGSSTFQPSALVLNETTATSTLVFQNPIDLNGSPRTVNVNANTATLSGGLSDSAGSGGGLIKGGAGTLIVAGANTYTGPTTLAAGKLYLNGSLAPASAISVAPATTFGGSGSAAR